MPTTFDPTKFGAIPVSKVAPTTFDPTQFGAKPVSVSEGFRYSVPKPVLTSQEKITKYNAEQVNYDAETKKSNSFMGTLSNAVKAPELGALPFVGGSVKTAHVLNKTIDKPVNKKQEKYNLQLVDRNYELYKIIRDKEKAGKDATADKNEYNNNQDQIDQNKKKVDEFNEKLPTNKQALAAVGQTGLDMLSVGTYGKAAKGSTTGELFKGKPSIIPKDPKILSKDTAKSVVEGAAYGAGYGATEALHRGEEGKEIIGETVIGATIGGLLPVLLKTPGAIKARHTKDVNTGMSPAMASKLDKAVKKRSKEITNIENNYVKLRNRQENPQRVQARKNLARTDWLDGSVDENGLMRTKQKGGAIDKLNEFLEPHEANVTKNVAKEGVELTSDQVEKKLIETIEGSHISGADRTTALNSIKNEVAGLRRNKNGLIDLLEVQNTKVYKGKTINYFNPGAKEYDKTVVRAFKELVEDHTKSINVKQTNKDLSDIYAIRDLLDDLDGKIVKGGKLGVLFSRGIGTMIGGAVGGAIGGLPGMAAGTVVGNSFGGKLKGMSMANKFKSRPGMKLQPTEHMQIAAKQANRINVKSIPSDFKKELPVIAFGNKGVSKYQQKSNLPIAEGHPKVYTPQKSSLQSSQVINKTKTIIPKTPISKTVPLSKEKVNSKVGTRQTVELPSGKKFSGVVEKRPLKSLKPAAGPKSDYVNETSDGYARGDIVENINTEFERPKNVGVLKNASQLPPIVVNEGGEIIDGNHRYAAAMKAGLKDINVIVQKSKSKEVVKKADEFLRNWTNTDSTKDGLSVFKKYPLSPKEIDELATHFKKISIPDENPPKFITLYRGIEKGQKEGLLDRPTAWTRLKEVAKDHTYGTGKVVKIKVTPDQVLVEMNALPGDMARKYAILGDEEEVILKPLLKKEGFLDKLKKIPNKQGGFISTGYKETDGLTTKILKDLEGKTTVSKQYILDATNRGELKQVEREITRQVLDSMKPNYAYHTSPLNNIDSILEKGLIPSKGGAGVYLYGGKEVPSASRSNAIFRINKNAIKYEDIGGKYKVGASKDIIPPELLEVSKDGGKTWFDNMGKIVKSDTINVKEFADKIKSELLPLKVHSPDNGRGGRYENIALSNEVRGKVKNYTEHIWESPIETKAGNTHFGGGNFDGDRVYPKKYFGHTRIEDMADDKTRRVIEVQSDLYQKGNLEREMGLSGKFENTPSAQKIKAERELKAKKLQQYNDPTAHFRMIREEIKKAAQDGKTKLQFPTGETAMKIEGLGTETRWLTDTGDTLLTTDIKKGISVKDVSMNDWIITDILGDGKFKALPKKEFENAKRISGLSDKALERFAETFDISGKVDTSNPIYKFYEKDIQKYLSKYGGKRIIDDKGVSWIEIPISKQQGEDPVEAFGKVGLGPLFSGAAIGGGAVGLGRLMKNDDKK